MKIASVKMETCHWKREKPIPIRNGMYVFFDRRAERRESRNRRGADETAVRVKGETTVGGDADVESAVGVFGGLGLVCVGIGGHHPSARKREPPG